MGVFDFLTVPSSERASSNCRYATVCNLFDCPYRKDCDKSEEG